MNTIALSRHWILGLGMLVVAFGVSLANFANRHSYDVAEVSLEQAKAMIDAGAVVIDVRAAEAGLAHIPGAHMIRSRFSPPAWRSSTRWRGPGR